MCVCVGVVSVKAGCEQTEGDGEREPEKNDASVSHDGKDAASIIHFKLPHLLKAGCYMSLNVLTER